MSSSSGDGPPNPGRTLSTHPTPLSLTPRLRPLPSWGQPLLEPPPQDPDVLPHSSIPKARCLLLSLTAVLQPPRSPSSPSQGFPNQPPRSVAPQARGISGLVSGRVWSNTLFLSASWAHLPGSLALLFQNCLLFSAAIALARGRPCGRARGCRARCPQDPAIRGPTQAASRPPVTRSQLLGAPSWMWAPLHPKSLPLVGCRAVVRQTNQEPESCKPLKLNGNVRSWAHRWTEKAELGQAERRGWKFLNSEIDRSR